MDRQVKEAVKLYVDCSAGIAGDMFLAAMLDMSGAFEHLKDELAKLPLSGYELKLFRDRRSGISGLRFDVETDEGHVHRHLSDIREMVMGSALSDQVREMTMKPFTLLAEAEGKVHGEPPEHVHFHEVGAVDSIIDITGAMVMLEYLGWPEIIFSNLNVGSGTVDCAHGVLPVPAPATAELLKGLPVYSSGDPMERVTPTGAVLVKALGGRISAGIPRGRMLETGIGLGSRDGTPPNILRVTKLATEGFLLSDVGVELSANIDDMLPQDLSYLMDKLFNEGALDVWFEQIQMKKNRPAVKVCALAHEPEADHVAETILRESSTLGVRRTYVERSMLGRRAGEVMTSLGPVRIKCGMMSGIVIKEMPEFEDIKKIAVEKGMPLAEVRALVTKETHGNEKDFSQPTKVQGAVREVFCNELSQDAVKAGLHHHGEHKHTHRHPHVHSHCDEESGAEK